MIYNFDDFSFKILTVGRFLHKEGHFNVKARQYASLSFRVSGTGNFTIGTKHFITKPGDVFFLPANTPYMVDYSTSESIVIHFDNCNYSDAENLCFENSSAIKICFENLLKTWKEQASINKSKSIIYDILDKMESDQRNAINETAVTSCVRYMEEHYYDPTLDVEALCAISFISVSTLQRAFAKHFGISPKQYLIQIRMSHALALLIKRKLSIKEISSACGFTDEKYFSRAFKKRYGYPPTQLQDNIII